MDEYAWGLTGPFVSRVQEACTIPKVSEKTKSKNAWLLHLKKKVPLKWGHYLHPKENKNNTFGNTENLLFSNL